MNQEIKKPPGFFHGMSLFKKIMVALAAFFLLLTVSAAVFYRFAGGTFDKSRDSKPTFAVQDDGETADDYGNYPNKVNILVLGVDDRKEDVGRSDTIFVVMLDTKTKETSLLSVPRDTRVLIPGVGWDKINHAFAYGGVELSKRTVESFLGIPINYYACVNFKGFYKIIDSLGGVNIDVEKRMYYEDPYDDLVINLQPGVQKLDGRHAIHYVRYRDGEGDIGRISRQQKFIDAVMRQAASPLILTRLPAIIGDAFTSVETDMTISEMVGLAKFLREAVENGLKTEMVQGTPTLINEVDYWIPDIMGLRAHIAKTQGAPSDQRWLSAARAQAGQYYNSIPADAQFDIIPFWLTDSGYVASDAPKKAAEDKDKNGDEQDSDDKDDNAKNINTKDNKTKDSKTKEPGDKKPDKAKPAEKTGNPKQPDKPKPPAVAAKPPAKTSAAAKPPAAKPPATQSAGPLRINIINASGSAEAATKMAVEMRRQGFEVAGVTTAKNSNQNTVVIANTTDSNVTGKLSALPFRYALRINDDAAKARQVTVIIGKDYLR